MSGGSGGCGWTRTTRESTSLVHGQRAHFSMQRGLVGHPRTESRHRPQSQSREQQSESEREPSALVVRSVPCCLQFLHRTRPKSESILYYSKFQSRAPPSRRLPLAANSRKNRKSKTPKAKRRRSSDVRRCRFLSRVGLGGPRTYLRIADQAPACFRRCAEPTRTAHRAPWAVPPGFRPQTFQSRLEVFLLSVR